MKKSICVLSSLLLLSTLTQADDNLKKTSTEVPSTAKVSRSVAAANAETTNKSIAKSLLKIADELAAQHPDGEICETDAYPGDILDYYVRAKRKDESIRPTKNIEKLFSTSLGYRIFNTDIYRNVLSELKGDNPSIFNGVVFHGPGMGVYGVMRRLKLQTGGKAILEILNVDDEGGNPRWVNLNGTWVFKISQSKKTKYDVELKAPALVLTFPGTKSGTSTEVYRMIETDVDNGGIYLIKGSEFKRMRWQGKQTRFSNDIYPDFYTIDTAFCEV